MHNTITKTHLLLITALLALSSCSNTRHLPAGDTLYTGTTVRIKDKETTRREQKVLKGDLQGAVRPKPNSTILGVRLKLSIYNLAGGDSAKKWMKWLQKIGEPPVLTSSFNMQNNKDILTNLLENRGFFFPSVSGEIKTRGRKSRSIFDVTTGPQYKIRNVQFPTDSSQLSMDIALQQYNTLLKKDAPYNLDLIKGERDRITNNLKEIGYYRFKSDYIIARVDSTVGDRKVDIYLAVKNDMPEDGGIIYFIDKVYIYPNYRLGLLNRPGDRRIDSIAKQRLEDTVFYDNHYYIVGNTKAYRPVVFRQAMQFEPGDMYNRADQNMSLNRLVNMGVFKFVKNDFEPVGDSQLNALYFLTPYPKKSLRMEIAAMSKSDSRVGSSISLSWRNRNTFRGAELFVIRGMAGIELQSAGGASRPNTYEFKLEPSLSFPRFAIPFIHPTSSSVFVPHTILKTSYDVQLRTGLYDLRSATFSYGFDWKENVRSEHQLFPINFTSVRTDTLNKDTTIFINYTNLIFNGVIFGPTYEYTYNSRGNGPPHHDDIYFDGLADLSGNIFGLAQGANVKSFYDKPKTLFGDPYAQYVKLQTDLRYYLNYGADPNAIWANRIIIGLGVPYGNSWQLPNIKQFFSGGNSSLRGFRSRLVGPGTFHDSTGRFIETSGDIKLELNTELRAKLYQFVNGAVFIDAGNVWTYNDNPNYPGGKFTSQFLKQLALDAGVGLRLDFKILVVRLDAGIPLHKPWLPAGQDWSFKGFGINGDNLILNLAIGYPF